MIIKHLPAIFEPARPVLRRIEDAGYEAYFVGGVFGIQFLGTQFTILILLRVLTLVK